MSDLPVITELTEEEKQEAEAREKLRQDMLARQRESGSGKRGGGIGSMMQGGSGMMQYVIMLLIAAAVAWFISPMAAVSKDDFGKNWTLLNNDITAVKASVVALGSRIDGLVSTVNGYSGTISNLSGSIGTQNSKIDSISAKVDTSAASLTSQLNDKVNTLRNEIADKEAKIVALQTALAATEVKITDDRVAITALQIKLSALTTLASCTILNPTLNPTQTFITNSGYPQYIPIQISNTSSTVTSIPLVLTITTANATIYRISGTMDGVNGTENPNIYGVPVTFNTSISAGANTTTYGYRTVMVWFYSSSGLQNGVAWTATWSKQSQ